MMKFFRKHKKAVSPVIAVMLLVAVAVAAVGAYFIWFRSFQTQTQGSVQQQASGALGTGLQVVSFANDSAYYYVSLRNSSSATLDVKAIKRGTDANKTVDDQAGMPVRLLPNQTATVLFVPSAPIPSGKTDTFTVDFNSSTSTGVLVHTYTAS